MKDDSTALFGFWTYLMTDLVLFAALFATFAVLRGGAEGIGAELFNPTTVLIETFVLLTSSFTCGMSLLAARADKKMLSLAMLALTFVLGVVFVVLEVSEFLTDAGQGMGPTQSGFYSSFFTLVGTHGLHVSLALLWMLILGLFIAARGFTDGNLRKLTLLTYFWHFLDIVWICIFTIVYLFALL